MLCIGFTMGITYDEVVSMSPSSLGLRHVPLGHYHGTLTGLQARLRDSVKTVVNI